MSPFQPLEAPPDIVRDLLAGRLVFAGASWEGEARVYDLVPRCEPSPLSAAERRVVALVSRGAANEEAGYVLGLAGTTVSMYLASAAKRLNARALDVLALGPLFERMEQR